MHKLAKKGCEFENKNLERESIIEKLGKNAAADIKNACEEGN
jgi:hypothetical protein